jgi:uncharacterized membrane protein
MRRGDYANAVRWLRAARPRRIRTGAFAFRCFGGSFVSGALILGLIAIVSPGSFGLPGRRVLSSGPWTWALLGTIAVAGLLLLLNQRRLTMLYHRIRQPYARPPRGHEAFEGAADSLASCPGAQHSRWAVAWVYVPAAFAAAGVTFAFSSAYFLVAAIISGGQVSWLEPALFGVNAVLSLIAWSLGAVRLSTWRLAVAVHREVTGRYPG